MSSWRHSWPLPHTCQQALSPSADLNELHQVGLIASKLLHVVEHAHKGVAQVVNQGHLGTVLQQDKDGVAGCDWYGVGVCSDLPGTKCF